MKKIILDIEDGIVNYSSVGENTPIFAKLRGELKGMITKEGQGWILRIGGSSGANGHHETRRKCMASCLKYGYEFFVI